MLSPNLEGELDHSSTSVLVYSWSHIRTGPSSSSLRCSQNRIVLSDVDPAPRQVLELVKTTCSWGALDEVLQCSKQCSRDFVLESLPQSHESHFRLLLSDIVS